MITQPFEAQLTAGTAWEWTVSLYDYPASAWELQFFFRGLGSKLDVTATADGDDFDVNLTPTDTAALNPGLYAWQMKVTSLTDPTQAIELGRGSVEIVADLQAQGTFDARTTNRQILDAIEATLKGMASRAEQEYSVQGRMLRLMSRQELEALRARYIMLCRNEAMATGQLGRNYNQVQARFGRTH